MPREKSKERIVLNADMVGVLFAGTVIQFVSKEINVAVGLESQ